MPAPGSANRGPAKTVEAISSREDPCENQPADPPEIRQLNKSARSGRIIPLSRWFYGVFERGFDL